MPPDPETPPVHSLLRIAAPSVIEWESNAPDWSTSALERLPFVVVRRAMPRADQLPVGIRGLFRSQRAPAWLPLDAVIECMTPRDLVACAAWRDGKIARSPAITVLPEVCSLLAAHGFAQSWGPGGSVGAELASGVKCTSPSSDLDLILYIAGELDRNDATRLYAELSALPVRIDTLLETPRGGISLADYLNDAGQLLLRTAQGPRLV